MTAGDERAHVDTYFRDDLCVSVAARTFVRYIVYCVLLFYMCKCLATNVAHTRALNAGPDIGIPRFGTVCDFQCAMGGGRQMSTFAQTTAIIVLAKIANR